MPRHRAPRDITGPVLLCGALCAWGMAAPAFLGQASASDLNCSDFTTQEQAQAYFEDHVTMSNPNPDGLDSNHNRVACESLPHGSVTGAAATGQVTTKPIGAVDAGDGSYP